MSDENNDNVVSDEVIVVHIGNLENLDKIKKLFEQDQDQDLPISSKNINKCIECPKSKLINIDGYIQYFKHCLNQ